MFATFVTLAIISFAMTGLLDLARQDGPRIVAALQGRSWNPESHLTRPTIVRVSPSYKAAKPVLSGLRAAA
jgi:hypothetical protein